MYESPIHIFEHRIQYDSQKQYDEAIFTAVVRADIHVDRDELIKALKYDRGQYEKGFSDGKADAQQWISVKDRLPPHQEKKVLVINGHGDVRIYALWKKEYGNKWTWIDENGKFNHVNDITHWMPLPEPPKEG